MKPRRKKNFGSLDSLLDTMTTVVGILVIMLIVVQLDVSSAVKRIIQQQIEIPADAVPLAKVDQTRSALASLQNQIEQIEKQTQNIRRQSNQDTTASEKILDQINALKSQQAGLKKKKESITKHNQHVKSLQKQLEDLKRTSSSESEKLKQAESELAQIPIPRRLPTKVVTLPDPKPAPKGAAPYYIMCRNGRVATIDVTHLRKGVAEHITKRSGLKKNADGEWDGDKIISYFNKVPVGSRNWRIKPKVSRFKLIFPLTPNRGAGETGPTAVKPTSRFVNTLRGLDPKKKYLVFLVWPDSYETYLAARTVASRGGFAIGWRPMDAPTWHPNLGNYPVYGYKKSLPPPKPPPTNPPAPAPPAKPKPVDVVD